MFLPLVIFCPYFLTFIHLIQFPQNLLLFTLVTTCGNPAELRRLVKNVASLIKSFLFSPSPHHTTQCTPTSSCLCICLSPPLYQQHSLSTCCIPGGVSAMPWGERSSLTGLKGKFPGTLLSSEMSSAHPLKWCLLNIFCRNLLECVPDWACEAKKLEILDVSYNLLTEVPVRYVWANVYVMYVCFNVCVCIHVFIFLDLGCFQKYFLLFSKHWVPAGCRAVGSTVRRKVMANAYSWPARNLVSG